MVTRNEITEFLTSIEFGQGAEYNLEPDEDAKEVEKVIKDSAGDIGVKLLFIPERKNKNRKSIKFVKMIA